MTKADRAKLDHRVVEQLGHARDIWSIQNLVAREVTRAVRAERKKWSRSNIGLRLAYLRREQANTAEILERTRGNR